MKQCKTSIGRGSAVVGVILITLLFGTSIPANAHGYGLPYHEVQQTRCSSDFGWGDPRTVVAKAPLTWYGYSATAELAAWSPDLQRWNGYTWVTLDTTAPFYYVMIDNKGPYSRSAAALANVGHVFRPAYPGYYRIKNWLWWSSSGVTHPHETTAYCYAG